MPSRFTPIQSNTSEDQRLAIINKNFAELDAEGVNKIYRGADGVPRIYIDGTTGQIKVAPAGVDVTIAADSQLDFNSSQRVFKVVQSGTLTVPELSTTLFSTDTYSDSEQSEVVTHNLGYTPAVLAFLGEPGGTYVTMPHVITAAGGTSGGLGIYNWSVIADDTQVYAFGYATEYGAHWAGGTDANKSERTITYYLLQETAN